MKKSFFLSFLLLVVVSFPLGVFAEEAHSISVKNENENVTIEITEKADYLKSIVVTN